MIEAITQCPECQTSFRVTEAQLRIAEGSVRCGACLNVFQAEDYLLSPLLDMTERLAIEQDYWLDFEDYMAQVGPVSAPAAHEEPGTIERDLSVVDGKSPFVDDLEKPFDLEFEPDPELLLRDHRRFFPMASLKWVPGILFLLLMLGAQWAFMNLQSFAQDEAYREQILTFCRVTGCAVPDYDNLGLLETRELIIRSHPEAASALMVDVLLRNSGDFRQAFPGLWLQFMDVRGNVVASRVFRSQEYLGGEMRGLRYIPALTEVRLSLEIADPGENALGYQMEVVRI
ncbi:MAG: DUF3426 domain-containing protein [Pseudomonadales bacterium]|nr:DUF3426 domain-containing protein [Pseudomonadales bacterium]